MFGDNPHNNAITNNACYDDARKCCCHKYLSTSGKFKSFVKKQTNSLTRKEKDVPSFSNDTSAYFF